MPSSDAIKKALAFKMPFGKHKGETLEDIAEDDVLYIDWLMGLDDLRPGTKEHVEIVAELYRKEIERRVDN